MSVRQNIVTKVDTNFKAISIANGYSFDISGNVFEWPVKPLDPGDLPCVIFRDTVDVINPDDEQEHNLDFDVILVDKGNTSPASVRNKMQDVLTAFSLIEDETYVAGAIAVDSELDVDHLQRKISAAYLRFTVNYLTEIWDI